MHQIGLPGENSNVGLLLLGFWVVREMIFQCEGTGKLQSMKMT